MNKNPYLPPLAKVEDPASIQPVRPPREVKIAFWLLWAVVFFGELNTLVLPFIIHNVSEIVVMQRLFMLPLTLGFWYWISIKILRGRNWARILLLILLSLVLIAALVTQGRLFQSSTERLIVYSCQVVLEIIAMWLVFIGKGREWFRRQADQLN